MRSARFTALVLACLILSGLLAAGASGAIVPSPNVYNKELARELPELGPLPCPQWLMPGYRLFYDVFYYDQEDRVSETSLLVIDVKGRGKDYVLTVSKSARVDEDYILGSFGPESHEVVDHTGVGEAWISLEALRGDSSPGVKSGLFKLGTFETMAAFDEESRAWMTSVQVSNSLGGSSSADMYYGRDNGLLLLLDIYDYDAQGNYKGGKAVQYSDFAEYDAPWLGYGLSGLYEGRKLEYDYDLVYKDGKKEAGTVTFTVRESQAGWARLAQKFGPGRKEGPETMLLVSEFCTDGLLFWLPREAFGKIGPGDVYFEDTVVGAGVTAGGPADLGVLGKAVSIRFEDGPVIAESYFREEDGIMVKYHRGPTQEEPFDMTFTLKGK
ncbi:MAG TPA: hypothetical protein PKK63_03110 [Bacillota bacterium]|nr:MAG: hypothetical protein BWY00_01569 [Firmicutes bacterium ADurb.Bin153]HNV34502.1 hypothetical protein [Bacillota bacterium]